MKLANIATLWAVIGLAAAAAKAETTVLFETGFESFEGYVEGQELWGQNGWIGFGSGGNGIVNEFFEGLGQQAFIGSDPPEPGDDFLTLLRPISFTPVEGSPSVVRFSVVMEIVDSTNEQFDDFRWSAYNLEDVRLFSLDFDNSNFAISYLLEGSETFESTGYSYELGGSYDLEIVMDFDRNQWRASLNDVVIVNAQPITNSPDVQLSLGDIDAVWVPHDPAAPGDNFMLFDNYRVTVESGEAMPVLVKILERLDNGGVLLRVIGEPGVQYVLEASPDLNTWDPIKTNTTSVDDGSFDFLDESAAGEPRRFYRVREATP